jgi:hypothetical protein
MGVPEYTVSHPYKDPWVDNSTAGIINGLFNNFTS